jgi:hypothetical protein
MIGSAVDELFYYGIVSSAMSIGYVKIFTRGPKDLTYGLSLIIFNSYQDRNDRTWLTKAMACISPSGLEVQIMSRSHCNGDEILLPCFLQAHDNDLGNV